MEKADLREQRREVAPVLGYAYQERRWERGVLWLLGIVCVSQFLTLPVGICNFEVYFHRYHSWIFLTPTLGIIDMCYTALAVGPVICGCLLLMQIERARGPFIASSLLVIVSLLVRLFFTLGFYRWRYGMLEAFPTLLAIAETAVSCYPLVLMAAVLKRSDGTQRVCSAAAIWWMTAGAALIVAAPAVFLWVSEPGITWDRHLVEVLSIFIGENWWRSLNGIGMISGSMASLSVLFAIAWTLYRGVSGRWALMICAALWIVFAAGNLGTGLGLEVFRLRSPYLLTGSISDWVYDLRDSVSLLSKLALYLAFPLAIRVALTLSDVREKLEGQQVERASEN